MRVLFVVFLLFVSSLSFAQSGALTSYVEEFKRSAVNSGYELIEEQHGTLPRTWRVSIVDHEYYQQGKEYMFVAIVDYCNPCKTDLHFSTNNQSIKQSHDLNYSGNLAIASKKFVQNESSLGQFDFYVDTGERYVHIMMFSK